VSLNNLKLTRFIKTFTERYLKTRPVVNISTCTGCEGCKAICPTGAINLFAAIPDIELRPKTGEPRYRPEVELTKCTRCCRCIEHCQRKALKIHKPLIMKILRL